MVVVQNYLKVMKAHSQCVESRERAAETDMSSIGVEDLSLQLSFQRRWLWTFHRNNNADFQPLQSALHLQSAINV